LHTHTHAHAHRCTYVCT